MPAVDDLLDTTNLYCDECQEPYQCDDARWRFNGKGWEHKCNSAVNTATSFGCYGKGIKRSNDAKEKSLSKV